MSAATKRDYVSETRAVERRTPITRVLEGEYVVRAYSILTTDVVVVEAWEPSGRTAPIALSHSTLTHDADYGWLGKVAARQLPADVAALPFGADRSIAVGRIRSERIREAREAIGAAFPELANVIVWDGADGRVKLADFHAQVAS